MPPASSPTSPAKKPRQVVDLELDSVALTENPSNGAAEIFIVRNKGGRVPTESTEEVARAAKALELERAALQADIAKLKAANAELLEVQRTQGAELERRALAEERAACVDIARSVAPRLKAKDVDTGDLLLRVRRAAKSVGDDKMETEFLALLRVGNAAAEAASGLTRSAGFSGGEGENPELPTEIARHVAPFMVEAKNDVVRAVTLAAAAAAKRGDNTAYSLLSSYKVS